MQNILKIENLKKYYGTKNNITKAIDNISFTVNEGEFVAIMGASGSGKTTLLNCISTIDTVTAGKIIINNKDITEIKDRDITSFRRNNLGFVFQDFNLLDTLTIAENISLSLIINKKNENKRDEMVNDIAKRLDIEGILDKFPYEVSGGQKQRCACARALINNPKLILADEPTGALDSKSSRMLLETMDEINKNLNATILMVTHDAFSASFCQRILFLKDGNIFTAIVATILAIQTLSDSTKYKYHYSILSKLGVEQSQIYKTIRKQLLIFFLFPVIYPLIIDISVTTSLNGLLNPVLSSEYSYLYAILYSLSLFLFIYLIYFIATYFGYKKNIEE